MDFGGQHYVPRQGNNSYIFPGVGLGVVSVRSTRVTDEMFMAAARTLAEHTSDADLAQGNVDGERAGAGGVVELHHGGGAFCEKEVEGRHPDAHGPA